MASQSPSTKRRQKNQENENDLLKYFKRMRVNESSQSTSAPLLTIDNLPSNTQLNVLQSIENIDKSITRKISPENNSSAEENLEMNTVNIEKEIELISDVVDILDVQLTTSATIATPTTNSSNHQINLHEIGVQLHLIESLLHPCGDLIKQSTSIDVCSEIFVEQANVFANKLVQFGNDLNLLCTSITKEIEMKRNKITINDSEKHELINRDPGYYDRNHKYSEEQLRYLVCVGPLQVKIEEYPKNQELNKTGKTCKFTSKWYDDFPYLEYSAKKDAAFCFTCRLFPDGPGSEKHTDAWVSTGVSSWNKMKSQGSKKKGKLEQHFSSTAHRASADRYFNFKNKKLNIDLMLDSNRMRENQEQDMILQLNKQVVVTLLDSARYLVRQGLAFRRNTENEGNFVQLIDVQRRNNQTLNNWFSKAKLEKYHISYLSHQSQNEYVHLLGETVERLVIDQINQSSFISIMADSTPDTSHREMYSIIIRFTKNYEAQERLLSIKELPSKVGEDICMLLLKTLQQKGISTEKLVAQCYDNAPNMQGIFKGVKACINNHLNRDIVDIPCGAHTSNLVVEHACDCSLEYINLFRLLQELYDYFASSAKRYYVFREEIDKSTYGLSIKSSSDTRWNANYESIHSVIESFDEIIRCFQFVETEKQFDVQSKLQAKNLRNKLTSYEMFILLKFMENVIRNTNSLTIHLQSKQLDILSSIELLNNTLKLIQIMRNDDQSLKNILLLGEKHVAPYDIDIEKEFNRLHRFRKPSCRIDPNSKPAVQLTRESFYLKLFRQILDHLHSSYSSYLNVLNNKLKCFINVTPNRIQNLTLSECKQMCEIIPKLTDPSVLYTEFQLLSDQIKESDGMSGVMKLLQQSGHLYPKVSNVYNYILTLPITIASNERSFSKMKLIKNYLRTTLTNDNLEYLLLCSVERDLLDKLHLPKLAEQWALMKNRRIKINTS